MKKMDSTEDILSKVQNHLYNLIIENKSSQFVTRHIIRNPQSIDESLIPETLSLLFTDEEGVQHLYKCTDPYKWMLLCQYIGDIVSDNYSPHITVELHNSTSLRSVEILNSYINHIKNIPIVPPDIRYDGNEWVYPSRENERRLYIHTGHPLYNPVSLFHVKIRKYIRDEDYEWFLFSLHHKIDDNMELPPRESQIDSINWTKLLDLLDIVELASFLGCESYAIYMFLFIYNIAVSLSCEERESLFGHKYFMLPIEGWNHPLRQLYHIPFLSEKDVENCTDGKYLEVAKECEI